MNIIDAIEEARLAACEHMWDIDSRCAKCRILHPSVASITDQEKQLREAMIKSERRRAIFLMFACVGSMATVILNFWYVPFA